MKEGDRLRPFTSFGISVGFPNLISISPHAHPPCFVHIAPFEFTYFPRLTIHSSSISPIYPFSRFRKHAFSSQQNSNEPHLKIGRRTENNSRKRCSPESDNIGLDSSPTSSTGPVPSVHAANRPAIRGLQTAFLCVLAHPSFPTLGVYVFVYPLRLASAPLPGFFSPPQFPGLFGP